MTQPTTTELDNRRFITSRVAVIVGSLLALAFPFLYAPLANDGPVICLMRSVFGIPCPGCGMIRALCALAQFDLSRALAQNALSLIVVAGLTAAAATGLFELSHGRPCRFYRFFFTFRFLKIGLLLVLVYHGWRLASWHQDGTLYEQYYKPSWIHRTF